jgi:phosphoglycolate phosphatase
VNLLFDLDGTLSDPVVGITRCIQHAMRELRREPAGERELARFVGPPLRETFATLLATGNEDLVSQAVGLYRERFVAVGMFENEAYPDVGRGLERLAADGHRLWVVTSKPHVYARPIVEHFGLRERFQEIYGSELDGRNADKAHLIREVLEKERMRPGDTWMIGDRAHDVRGGRLNGTRTAGVLWGYGTEEELRAEGPDLLADSMDALVAGVSRP